MAQGDITITVVGNLTAPPELRFTPSGAAVASFTVASTPRVMDKASGEWKDGTPTFLDCQVWRQAAEHAAECLDRGSRVVVVGRLRQESWEDRNGGGKRSKLVLDVDEVAPSLRYAVARIQRMERGSGGNAPVGGGGGDPWSSPAPSGGPTRTANFDDEPPF